MKTLIIDTKDKLNKFIDSALAMNSLNVITKYIINPDGRMVIKDIDVNLKKFSDNKVLLAYTEVIFDNCTFTGTRQSNDLADVLFLNRRLVVSNCTFDCGYLIYQKVCNGRYDTGGMPVNITISGVKQKDLTVFIDGKVGNLTIIDSDFLSLFVTKQDNGAHRYPHYNIIGSRVGVFSLKASEGVRFPDDLAILFPDSIYIGGSNIDTFKIWDNKLFRIYLPFRSSDTYNALFGDYINTIKASIKFEGSDLEGVNFNKFIFKDNSIVFDYCKLNGADLSGISFYESTPGRSNRIHLMNCEESLNNINFGESSKRLSREDGYVCVIEYDKGRFYDSY